MTNTVTFQKEKNEKLRNATYFFLGFFLFFGGEGLTLKLFRRVFFESLLRWFYGTSTSSKDCHGVLRFWRMIFGGPVVLFEVFL